VAVGIDVPRAPLEMQDEDGCRWLRHKEVLEKAGLVRQEAPLSSGDLLIWGNPMKNIQMKIVLICALVAPTVFAGECQEMGYGPCWIQICSPLCGCVCDIGMPGCTEAICKKTHGVTAADGLVVTGSVQAFLESLERQEQRILVSIAPAAAPAHAQACSDPSSAEKYLRFFN
jgi:hypothetical protein